MRPLLLSIVLSLLVPDARATQNAMDIFVSIAPQKYLVQRIGGERVNVTVMLKSGQSPETYDPLPRQIAGLAGARIYFLIGVPFEKKWRNKFRQQNKSMRMVDTSRQCRILDHDPHVWTSPMNAVLLAREIRAALVAVDPASARFYDANFHRLVADLEQLDGEIMVRLKHRRTNYFIVSHDAWAYYAERYGLRQIPLESRGREKGPRGIAGIVEQARREKIHTLFVQQQHPESSAYTLATELGAQVMIIDPLAGDYIDNLRHVTASIAEAIQ